MSSNTERAKKGKIWAQLEHRQGVNDVADWCSVDVEELAKTIDAAASAGGALRFGYTRDGGAYSIGIYGDGEPYTVYVRPNEDIDAALASIRLGFEDIGRPPAGAPTQAPKSPKKPSPSAIGK